MLVLCECVKSACVREGVCVFPVGGRADWSCYWPSLATATDLDNVAINRGGARVILAVCQAKSWWQLCLCSGLGLRIQPEGAAQRLVRTACSNNTFFTCAFFRVRFVRACAVLCQSGVVLVMGDGGHQQDALFAGSMCMCQCVVCDFMWVQVVLVVGELHWGMGRAR